MKRMKYGRTLRKWEVTADYGFVRNQHKPFHTHHQTILTAVEQLDSDARRVIEGKELNLDECKFKKRFD